MTRTRHRALLPLVALALLAAPPARGDEQPAPDRSAPEAAPGTAPEAPASAPAEAPPFPQPTADDTWVDVGHGFVERHVFLPVLWFDRFFSDEREIEPERQRSFLRWRSEVRLQEGAPRPGFTTGVRATLRLPSLNDRLRRLRIVIAGDTRDTVDALLPRDPAEVDPVPETATDDDTVGGGDAGLRFYLWDTLLSHASLGGGVLIDVPPGVYGRLRFRWAIPVGNLFLARAALVGFWRSDVKFGTSASLELERPVVRTIFVRLSGGGTVTEESAGVEWSSELAFLAPLPPRSGVQVGVAVSGATEREVIAPDPETGLPRAWRVPVPERTRAYARYRRNVLRHWLFVEIEPEAAWPWTPERGRFVAWGLALRVEVQFHGRQAPAPAPPPPAPPPPPPEPADPLPRARSPTPGGARVPPRRPGAPRARGGSRAAAAPRA